MAYIFFVQDESLLKTWIIKTIENNFCVSNEGNYYEKTIDGLFKKPDSLKLESASLMENTSFTNQEKPLKKAVTFKTGLVSERNNLKGYNGALITTEQVWFFCLVKLQFVNFNYKILKLLIKSLV